MHDMFEIPLNFKAMIEILNYNIFSDFNILSLIYTARV